MPEDTISLHFRTWLKKNQLTIDPFESFEAEKERQFLNYVWVDRPYFHDILGNPRVPCPAVLFAGRGDGKTATREMVFYECIHAETDRKALPVRYRDFYGLLEQAGDPSAITLRQHVSQIIRQILRTLAQQDIVPARTFDNIEDADRELLAGFVDQFADPVAQLPLQRLLACNPPPPNWSQLSPFELLQLLAALVARLKPPDGIPFQSIYVLVDQVDESSAGGDAALDILRPLIKDRMLLDTPGIAFKFFLSSTLEEAVRQTLPVHYDRVVMDSITWSRDDLKQMIDIRLKVFSGGSVLSLEELCEKTVRYRVMERLMNACDNSPRTLLRLCHQLLLNHVRENPYAPLITAQTVNNTISDYLQLREKEMAAAPANGQAAEASAPSERGLFVDTGGQVWVDGQLLASPLTEKEFALLRKLYVQSGKIVSQEELIGEIWRDSDQGQGPQNLRKLVARLREHLEPNLDDRESRFIRSVKGRGYWLARE